ncbi:MULTISPECIES: AraC family transcriptional regulator [unclassified Microbacterium]|uniref:AraC family transcriptional regulator n=1 Tax=unclassified Microbacterium TaxID=2609290 RepID=UPI00191FEE27|nr:MULTISPECIES: AraC family transcriptional regulator [unclassified Microbacterium]QYM63853.1 AraC family transcriptional regulator [Microbacterium sp. Se5.02b]
MPDRLDTLTGNALKAPPFREVIPRDPGASFRWHEHDYPNPLARWNRHPEYEIHLIRHGAGRYIIGDAVGPFGAGQLFFVGSNLPHDWISDLRPGDVLPGRDVVLQFDPAWFERLREVVPELGDMSALLARSRRGIEFRGETAREGARLLESIGSQSGAAAIADFLSLLAALSRAPSGDFRTLSSRPVDHGMSDDPSDVVASALDYIFANLDSEPRLSVAARIANMSESAFSRYFKNASGQTFSGMVKRLRLTQACRLLVHTDATVAQIAQSVGYSNLSNFNRRFRDEYDMTPSDYRRTRVRAGLSAVLMDTANL